MPRRRPYRRRVRPSRCPERRDGLRHRREPGPGHGPDVRLARHRDRVATAWPSCSTPRTGGRATRSPTAPTAGHGSPSPSAFPTIGPIRPCAVRPVHGLRSRVPQPRGPALSRAADRLRGLRSAPVAGGLGRVRSGRGIGRGHRGRSGGARTGGDRRDQGSRRVPPGLRRRLRCRRAAAANPEAPPREAIRRNGP